MKFADLILPVAVGDLYTYSIPQEMQSKIFIGMRCTVSFGPRKTYVGLIRHLHDEEPKDYKVKPIKELIDERPLYSEKQLAFNDWISQYYMCTYGDVFKAALPASMRGEEETYKPKLEKCVRLAKEFSEEELAQTSDKLSLGRAKAQEKLFLCYLNLSQICFEEKPKEVKQSELLRVANVSPAALKSLCDKKILQVYTEEVSRIPKFEAETQALYKLSETQEEAYKSIKNQFQEKDTVLLYGVTSSGKTEVYTHLINDTLKQGKQVLYLLPEIALTSQLTVRLQSFFGKDLTVYHSKFSNQERVEVWKKMQSDNPYPIVLGARSSIFLPFNNLGLIIIDEEHETSYKQQSPAPRYHARDAALVLAKRLGAKCLLGSATPSIESAHNSQTGKYGMVKLEKRYSNVELPEIILADTLEARKKNSMKASFTPLLYTSIKESLEKGKQILLFQNRRGYASFVKCDSCGEPVKCKHCDISLTYHKFSNKLICHHCGFTQDMAHQCPNCDSNELSIHGLGTEKIEEQVAKLFPKSVCKRMDLDTAGTKNKIDSIISDFQDHKIDILIGTQMISKGLDFDNVSVVGVMNADSIINFPDFRAYERAYQLLAQVSGRAGRRGERGKVIIQTSEVENPIFSYVVNNDFNRMYYYQIKERKEFVYPPFYRMIEIIVSSKNESSSNSAAKTLAIQLKQLFGIRISGPFDPLLHKVNNKYYKHIILKIEPQASISKAKKILLETVNNLKHQKGKSQISIRFNVDPQ